MNVYEENKLTLGVFNDFSKAFDRINHITLLKKLTTLRIPWITRGHSTALLKPQETMHLHLRRISDSLNLEAGVPQGNILGHILFNIYINDLTNISNLAHYITYEDDISLFFQSFNADNVSQLADTVLDKLYW